VAGFLGAVYDPAWFVAQQIPKEKPLVASENSIVLAHQLGNLYLGMCFVGLSLFWSTSEVKVIRSYLVALLIADAGHVGFTWYGMGSDRFFDVSGWNAMAWGNLGATVSVSCWTCIVAVTCVGIAANHVSNCHSCSLPLPALRISQASLVQIMPLQAPSNQARKRVKPFDRLQSCNRMLPSVQACDSISVANCGNLARDSPLLRTTKRENYQPQLDYRRGSSLNRAIQLGQEFITSHSNDRVWCLI
jgi:hypothetical protein